MQVDDPAIARAMRDLIQRERLIVEGASAVAVAALLALGDDVRGRRVGVVLSGRNVDPQTIARVLDAGSDGY
jgi:threonine dehydratase